MDKSYERQSNGRGHHGFDIKSLLNPSPSLEEPTIPGTNQAHVSANGVPSFEAPAGEPTFSEQKSSSILSDENRRVGSFNVEPSSTHRADSAYHYHQAHQGHRSEGIEGSSLDQQEDTTMAEAPPSPQHEDSERHSAAADNVSLPDDGYYPTSLHVDSEMSDTDSALGSEIMSSTMSLRSSLYESIQENGRSYHKYKEGQYYLPNDDVEQDRLNLQHHLWTLTLDGRLHLAPTENPQRVMDIGTGTGLWALEYAERNPSSIVTGTGKSYPRSQRYIILIKFQI